MCEQLRRRCHNRREKGSESCGVGSTGGRFVGLMTQLLVANLIHRDYLDAFINKLLDAIHACFVCLYDHFMNC